MAVRAYLFDYGGTLDGEGWHWFDRFCHLYREAGVDLPEASIKAAFYAANERIAEEARARSYRLHPLIERHVELQIEVLGDGARRVAPTLVRGFCEMSEAGWAAAREALGRLRQRARLGVVSNFYGNLDVLLAEAGLSPLLEVVVESTRVGLFKPDPRIYAVALERLDLTAAEVIMVGDNFERDLCAAKKLGMGTAWLRRVEGPLPEPGIADRVIRRLADLL